MSSAPPSPNALFVANPFTSNPNPSSVSLAGNPTANSTVNQGGQLPLAERADIHKSCKTLEALLSVLNEYCEAASAICALQKRMAKALRDTAACKTTGEIAGNALQTTATIFDALADADARFAKGVDKEYDAISSEVKKWFKKLAKEEKNHDERMAGANAKIKQAGQVYEKKSKRKGSDAASATDEHARYIALISTLGPEIAQDKYNHALLITQRHSTTTHNVAGSLARVADGEWVRLCDCVRRSAPAVGPLGQWRALCEGGWLGGAPDAFFSMSTQSEPQSTSTSAAREDMKDGGSLKPIEEEVTSRPVQKAGLEPPLFNPPGYSTGPPSAATSTQDLTLAAHQKQELLIQQHEQMQRQAQELPQPRRPVTKTDSPVLSRNTALPIVDASGTFNDNPNADSYTALEAPRAPFAVGLADDHGLDPNTGSVRTLSAFPSPPSHYPTAYRQRSSLGLNSDAMGIAQAHSLASMASSGVLTPNRYEQGPDVNSGGRNIGPGDITRRMTESPMQVASNSNEGRGAHTSSNTGNAEVHMEREVHQERDGEREIEKHLRDEEQNRENALDRELELQRELEAIQKRRNATQVRRPVPIKAHTASLPHDARAPLSGTRHGGYSSVDLRPGQAYRGDVYDGDDETREFGLMSSPSGNSNSNGYRSNDDTPRARAAMGAGGLVPRDSGGAMRPLMMERVDTGMSTSSGTGSLVAAMRNRYTTNSGSTSPQPRDLSKLPLSVTNMADRYQGGNVGEAPGTSPRARSPPVARQQSLPMLNGPGRRAVTAQEVYQARRTSGTQHIPLSGNTGEHDQIERRAKEQELIERERELELKTQALERDRARLQNFRGDGRSSEEQQGRDIRDARTGRADLSDERGGSHPREADNVINSNDSAGPLALKPRERRTSLRHPLQRPPSQISGAGDETDLRQKYAYGATLLAASSSTGNMQHSPTKVAYSPKQYRQPLPRAEATYEGPDPSDRHQYGETPMGAGTNGHGGGYSSNTTGTNASSHASNCGCETCSVSKYKSTGREDVEQKLKQQAGRVQAPATPERQRVDSKPEKTKSWMRRLSMPGVGNAFISDAKKQSSTNVLGGYSNGPSTNYSLGSGVGHTPEKTGRGLFSLRNSSTTGLRQANDSANAEHRRQSGAPGDSQQSLQAPREVGAGRRSYVVGNRSATNIGSKR